MPRPLRLLTSMLLASLGMSAALTLPALPPPTGLPPGFSLPLGGGDSIYPALGSAAIDVTHYDLSLMSDPASETLSGRAVLTLTAKQTLTQLSLDFAGPTTSEVLLDGQPARFVQAGEKLLILLPAAVPAGTPLSVSVTYHGTPARPLDPDLGLRLGWITADDASYTLAEPDAAHSYFPCNDLPADGASYTLHLNVPEGYQAVASGVQTGERREGTRHLYDFELPQPIPTYALGIQVGRLELVTRPAAGKTALRDAFPLDLPATLRAPFERTPQMLSALEHWFGPYPFAVYGVGVTRDARLPALETATFSTFPARVQPEVVAVHELSHQWFGDSLRLGDWSDVWLNEGFATYAEALWAESLGQSSAPLLKRWYDALARQPSRPLPATTSAQLFDASSYLRGALTLHALRLHLGDDAFRTLLHSYAARFAGQSVRTADFVALVGELSGDAALAVIRPWLFQAALPPFPKEPSP